MERGTDAAQLFHAARAGDRVALGRAITLIESTRAEDRLKAGELVELSQPHSGTALRLGITGIPGVGKSTLNDALGRAAIHDGRRVAVLATDPSSLRSHGSILGDKTRMELLSRSEQAFIRPTASAGHLGGVARRTRETALLCAAAGFDLVLIETVGVGQSELEVDDMADLNLLLMIPGAGDELQGIKRGIMESADVIVLERAELWAVSREKFERFLESDCTAGYELMHLLAKELCHRLRMNSEAMLRQAEQVKDSFLDRDY